MFEICGYLVVIVIKLVFVIWDVDILVCLVECNLVKVVLLVIMLDCKFCWVMELCVLVLYKWFVVVKILSEVGVFVFVMMVLVILVLIDSEIEIFLEMVVDYGVIEVGFVFLCLLLEVLELFCDWLLCEWLDCYCYVMNLICFMWGGKDYDVKWGEWLCG